MNRERKSKHRIENQQQKKEKFKKEIYKEIYSLFKISFGIVPC